MRHGFAKFETAALMPVRASFSNNGVESSNRRQGARRSNLGRNASSGERTDNGPGGEARATDCAHLKGHDGRLNQYSSCATPVTEISSAKLTCTGSSCALTLWHGSTFLSG